jgi:glutamate:Na+ symporter, ESS family
MENAIIIPGFISVTMGFAVFLLGARLNSKLLILRRFNIPEPVSGGLIAAVLVLLAYKATGLQIRFEMEGRDLFLVTFFAAIGLNARLSDLLAGGRPLAILLLLTLATILAQNLIGVAGALAFGYPAKAGVLFGSAALIGGHGTAIAWAPEVATATGLSGASELGVAVATLGLVLAAMIGGPVARFLIERNALTSSRPDEEHTVGVADDVAETTTIDHLGLIRVMLYLNLAIIFGYGLHQALLVAGLKLPLFVPCLVSGIVLGNLRSLIAPNAAPVARTPVLALVSEFTLGIFLAMSLMSLQLWTIADLGLTIAMIMLLQTLFAAAFVLFVLFPMLGGNYRAAVLAAGFGGFALGATPTAIANMTAVTKHYGPSPIAFVVLPLVSAFFVDIANAIVIQAIVNF